MNADTYAAQDAILRLALSAAEDSHTLRALRLVEEARRLGPLADDLEAVATRIARLDDPCYGLRGAA